MRLKVILCGVTASAFALLLTGCGMDEMSMVTPNTDSPAIEGRAMGARQPVTGARIEIRQMGTGAGYGTTGTMLAFTTTDGGGNFSFAAGAYTCPQSNTPVYLLGIGGNTGAGAVNPSAVLGAGLGTCANGKNSFTIMNEVTTTALAFTLAHFFSTTMGGTAAANDWFGGPSTGTAPNIQYSQGLVMGNSATIPSIVSNAVGAPNQNHTGYVVEAAKINTIANILANCVNTTGATSTTETTTPCGRLFNLTANGATPRPSDTLQAAVQMALHPATNVTPLFNLIVAQSPFAGLTAAPHDWTIGVSYTTPALGLGVNTGTLSTLDIDASGRVWFPSNAAGKVGAAYFDPASQSFNGPFNSPGLVHPQQVAIDSTEFAWYNDSATDTVGGYMVTAPTTTQPFSLSGWTSSSLTIGGDNRVYVGVTNSTTLVDQLAAIPTNRSSYTLFSTTFGASVTYPFPPASMAGDSVNSGVGVVASDPVTPQFQDFRLLLGLLNQMILSATNANSGQVVYTGGINYISSVSAPTTGPTDALCDYQNGACNTINVNTATIRHGLQGMALDGNNNLWVSESANGGVLQVPVANAANTTVVATEFLHDTAANGGGTPTATRPYGIGIDATGNVWMTNAGCTTTGCTPGNFTLTEVVGAGVPTITPVSAQITGGSLVGTRPTN